MLLTSLSLCLALSLQPATAGTELLLSKGQQAPPFSMRDLNRKIFSLADHVGKTPTEKRKAVLLSFFATWCKPCIKEIPIVRKLHSKWKAKSVEVIYIGQSQSARELTPFVKQHTLPWRVVPDTFGLLSRRYGASQLPHIVLINSDGKIAFQHRGISANLEAVLNNEIARLVGEPVRAVLSVHSRPRFNKKLSMGRAPSMQGSASRWQPLANYIGEAVGASIEVRTAESYEQFEKELMVGKYDLVNAGPLLCSKVEKQYVPVVRVERQGTPTYLGLIFAKRSSGLSSITDLRGKTLALVSRYSTSGGLYVLQALLEAGLKPDKDVRIVWTGSHAAVAEAVKSGKADAGGCFEDCRDLAWRDHREKVKKTRILAYTAEIPAEMILVRRTLKKEIRQVLRSAMLRANERTTLLRQISEGELSITALTQASESDLQPIAAVIERVSAARLR